MTDAENQPDKHDQPETPDVPTSASAAPAPVPASASSGSTDLLASLDVSPPSMVRAITVGALAYAITWVVGLACTALVIVLAYVEDVGDDVSWWWLLTMPGQLVATAFRSPAVMSVSGGDEDFALSGSASSTASLLTLLAVALVAAFGLSRRDEGRSASPSTKGAVTLAVTTALTFVLIGWLLALILRVSITEDGSETTFGAGQFQLILFGTLAVGAVALIGRRPWSGWPAAASIPLAARSAWRGVLVHMVVFSVLTIPAAIIWIIAEDGASVLLALPALVGNLLVYALTIGHLGALKFGGVGSFLGESDSDFGSVWLFSDDADKVLWLLLLFAVIGVLASAAVLHQRGEGRPRAVSHWVWVAVVYAAVGGVLTFLGTASTGVGTSGGASGSVSFGPVPWFLLVFAAWGLIAEAAAQFVGPALVSSLPAGWVERAAGRPGALKVSGSAAAGGPEVAGATPPVASPIDPRSKRILISIGAIVATVVVAAVGISVAGGMFFGPEKQAEKYMTALGDGDVTAALALARLDYTSEERVLLTDDVLGEGGAAIDDIEVGDVEQEGDLATVTVDYTVDGAEQSQDMTLKKSGSRFVVFDDWEIVDPELGSLFVTAAGATGLEVNGKAVDVSGLDDGTTLPVFPGKYEITPTTGSTYLEFGAQSVTVGTDEESADFEVTPSSDLASEVSAQAKSFLDACIAKKEAEPDGCPNQTYGYELEDVRWKLDAEPTYSLESDFSGGWRFQTSKAGSATVVAKETSFFDDEPAENYTDTVTIDISGTVSIEGDTVTIKVDDYF